MTTKQKRHGEYVGRKRARRNAVRVGKKKQMEQERIAIKRNKANLYHRNRR